MPETIIIDNFSITEGDTISLITAPFIEQSKNIVLDEVDGKPNINKMIPPRRIIIRNNKSGLKYLLPDSEFFKNTEIIFED